MVTPQNRASIAAENQPVAVALAASGAAYDPALVFNTFTNISESQPLES